MTLPQGLLKPDVNAAGIAPAPFAAATVTLTRQEHVQLVMDVAYWRVQFDRRVARDAHRERSYRRFFDQLKEHSATREAVLIAELELARALVRDLQQRVFGRKTERGRCVSERAAQPCVARTARGQRHGSAGHGRTMQTELPRRSERVELDAPQCPQCGLELGVSPGTEDSEVLEIEVQAYRRVIRRQRYHPRCTCGCVPGIVSAPAPARLIERGKFGVSVWTTVLLDKFLYGRPSHRLIEDLGHRGLQISAGTRAGGLQAIAPMFVPLDRALALKLRSQSHWHADETRWAVFADVAGKVGHRWCLWVFHSSAVVHYVLDESRSADVIQAELVGVEQRTSVMKILSELGPDLSRFANVKHFCSWLGLCPATKISGGKVMSASTKRSANRVRQALKMAAMSLSRSQSALGAFYRRLCGRMDKPRANTATAHKLARMVYFMLTRGEAFVDQGQQRYEEQQRQRSIAALKRRAAALGFQVTPTGAAA